MDNTSFKIFKEKYLSRFRLYYKRTDNKKQRDEIKRSIFDNPNLTVSQKNEFWEAVIK